MTVKVAKIRPTPTPLVTLIRGDGQLCKLDIAAFRFLFEYAPVVGESYEFIVEPTHSQPAARG